MIKYIFFDVAGTLLNKPSLYKNINDVLVEFGYNISIDEIKYKHKLLSEVIHFPDRTDEKFYKKFNSELLYLLGIVPTDELINIIFRKCTYLPWEKFEDTSVLAKIDIPKGIISNFNITLKEKLNNFFDPIFHNIFVSEELGVAKPNIQFYKKACEQINIIPEQILYIGDSLKLDIEPALKIGIKALLIDRDNFYTTSRNKINSLKEITHFI